MKTKFDTREPNQLVYNDKYDDTQTFFVATVYWLEAKATSENEQILGHVSFYFTQNIQSIFRFLVNPITQTSTRDILHFPLMQIKLESF